MTEKHLKTGQNAQKRPKNHLELPEKGLKLAKICNFLLAHEHPTFPCYTKTHLKIQVGLLAALANGPPGFLGGFW